MTIDLGNLRINQKPETDGGPNPDLGHLSRLPGKWSGSGFNAIWRPNGRPAVNPQDFFLELNRTTETLEFAAVKGSILNRVHHDTADTQLRAVSYLQQICDSKIRGSDGLLLSLHVEPGFWLSMPATVYPGSGETVARQALIPHGVSLVAQGVGMPIPPDELAFPTYDLMPFDVPNNNFGHGIFDGVLNLSQPDAGLRTKIDDIVDKSDEDGGVTRDHLQRWINDPNLALTEGLVGKNITNITQLQVAVPIPPIYGKEPQDRAAKIPPSSLDSLSNKYGGGISSIPFLLGNGAPATELFTTGPNAQPPQFEATFYIEEFDVEGVSQWQLQYTQRVLLSFGGFLWPHVSVASLRKQL